MPSEIKKEIALEIAHVLFLDVVGYSKLLVDEQRAVIDELNRVVRDTDEYREAESAGRLIKIPTGDGMALVFHTTPEAPVESVLCGGHLVPEVCDFHVELAGQRSLEWQKRRALLCEPIDLGAQPVQGAGDGPGEPLRDLFKGPRVRWRADGKGLSSVVLAGSPECRKRLSSSLQHLSLHSTVFPYLF